ncbi:aconitate hydratase AcnA [Paracoccus sp. Z118]|uniref:aconitate hydratase AcnA n=1 Tax=Paracoccus sp. Z118 TaxID=2851017 RepID=UPI001C2C0B70|nr:aconitate hydratase AcnA [Paracoccus sp. Z118]MBV0893245.1 aconitate hydratase AcnA [Paracoccus sp. Z118]
MRHHVSTASCANPDLLRPAAPGLPSCLDFDAAGIPCIEEQPRSLRVLAEDILYRLPLDQARTQIEALITRDSATPITFAPQRALLQDFMGVPLIADMASMRDAVAGTAAETRGNSAWPDAAIPVDFVVDHSLTVFFSGNSEALALNRRLEMERNRERFQFIKWCDRAFGNMRVIPPGRGIMHQVNLEWLSHVVALHGPGAGIARPDTMIGTDSHTTMVNALGILGWGVGGIEAEMAILGVPLVFAPPLVVGVRLAGALPRGSNATDLVLHMTEFLRGVGVVGAFVEFHGEGVADLSLADRATIANMAPEYGATCAWFPIDRMTVEYLRMTGRDEGHLRLVEAVARAQGLWQDPGVSPHLSFDEEHVFDLGTVEPSMSGPVRPEERLSLAAVPPSFARRLAELRGPGPSPGIGDGPDHGAVVIAAITSCTNTSNPEIMMAAGLLARNAVDAGLRTKPWVKTSLAPGSRAVTDYLAAAGLMEALDTLGFNLVGYGCGTCNGNSGPLGPEVTRAIEERDLCTVAVLSGNRNFEGRIHPLIAGAYLASPPLVVAAALAGTVSLDLGAAPLGTGADGRPVHLADIWPEPEEIADHVRRFVNAEGYRRSYAGGMGTTEEWEALDAPGGLRFPWDEKSLFIRPSPFPGLGPALDLAKPLRNARVLLLLGDSITTDHISPNGAIRPDSPAGRALIAAGADPGRLGNYGARRGNSDICHRGMFDNPLLQNELVSGQRGNLALVPAGGVASVFEAAEAYATTGTPLVIVAGRNYGAGSSRDWAAKGLRLLGVKAVIAESFERIHRSNLVGMGVLPIVLTEGTTRHDFTLEHGDLIDIELPEGLAVRAPVRLDLRRNGGHDARFNASLDVMADAELEMIRQGGILPALLARAGGA